jgi:hypothetical protein
MIMKDPACCMRPVSLVITQGVGGRAGSMINM